ncbi:MAG: hypothetical protein ABUL53_01975 [Bradyrhizobium guangdongense]|jgi:hypothetical protein
MAKRSRKKQTLSFDERLQRAADEARDAARKLPIGRERDALMKKARQTDTAARINQWLTSPGLQSPK